MDWWEGLFLTCLAVAAVFTARDIWHQTRCPACKAARQVIRERHPDWQISSSQHRASEPHRDVVAVFYMPPRVWCEPTPYCLVAVGHDGMIEELPDDIDSPYAIRGRK
jgi:hypothetical protein